MRIFRRRVTQVPFGVPPPADKKQQIQKLKGPDRADPGATPDYNAPRAHSLEDASLFVLAEGPGHDPPGNPGPGAGPRFGHPPSRQSLGPRPGRPPRVFLEVFSPKRVRPFRKGRGFDWNWPTPWSFPRQGGS
ncbi:MAG: hypothetical protein Ct9H300mP1_11210 [Planctomycetaceae bacterium]|nr:MAG: hypothetical protein Ct9H300mP1_11210 [Planctomycetaceae bacterium]